MGDFFNILLSPLTFDPPWFRPLEERKKAWWWCEETEKHIKNLRKSYGLNPDE